MPLGRLGRRLRTASLVAGLASILVATSAAAASAQTVEFRGGGYLSNLSQACQDAGWAAAGPFFVNVRYQPPRLGANGPQTRLSFYLSHYAAGYTLARGNLNRRFQPVAGGAVGPDAQLFDRPARMRVVQQTPANVRMGTPRLRLRGQIRRMDSVPGCTADFDVSLTRRPW